MNETDSVNQNKAKLLSTNDNLFEGVIGQLNPKRELKFYLDSYISTRRIPHLGIIAPKGQGKTKLARAIAKGLYQFNDEGKPIFQPSVKTPGTVVPKRKPLVEINCSTIKNLKAFINGIIIKFVQDKDVTLFFDEASEIPHDVSMALLTILEPNATHRTSFAYDEFVCDFDFTRQSFIFATTESQSVFHALMDRLERITLQEYSAMDLSQMVRINLPDVKIEDNLLLEVSSVLRGNARAAVKMAEKIMAYLKGGKLFSRGDWDKLRHILSITPLGLNAIEVQIMRFLKESPQGTSLTGMSAKTGMSREQIRQDSEMYLLKHSLMEISTTGRNITAKGLTYLKVLDGKLPSCAAV
jgi:Holliday junction resolvasome RuvABC ATP-dependent DNA helicase subunit